MAGYGQDDEPTFVGDVPGRDDKTIVGGHVDADQTIVGSPHGQQPTAPQPIQSAFPVSSAPPQRASKAPWIIAVIAIAFLCLLVVGAGIVFGPNLLRIAGPAVPGGTQTVWGASPSPMVVASPGSWSPTLEAPPTPGFATPTAEVMADTPTSQVELSPEELTVTLTPKATSTSEVAGQPAMGTVTFAEGATDDAQPIGASDVFSSDITEVHAVFEYSGFEDGVSWERRWYKNGKKVGGGTGTWSDGPSGTYHMSLNSGGQALGVGDWKLEIYVDGALVGSGEFSIELGAEPTPEKEASPTAEVEEVEPTIAVASGGGTYRLAFSRWDGGKHNLFVADTNGDNEVFVLERASGPSWAPDGCCLYAYGSEGVDRQVREGQEYTWPDAGISNGIIRLDITTLADGIPSAKQDNSWKEGTGRYAALSPDGSMLAFDAQRGGAGSAWRIYFLGTYENLQYQIEIPGEQVSWSPDSNQLVYRSGRDNRQGIWISNRDDSGAVNLTGDGSDAFPRWSPDGRKIAFHRDSGDNVDIYTMNVDGSNVRRLTDAAGPDTLPTWTPDGRIVFRSARSGGWGIYIMNADSGDQELIVSNADPGPDWAFGRMDVH